MLFHSFDHLVLYLMYYSLQKKWCHLALLSLIPPVEFCLDVSLKVVDSA